MTDVRARDHTAAFAPLVERYGRRIDPGTLVYGQGAVTRELYLVLTGHIVFEVVDSTGSRAVVHQAWPGDCFGHVGAFSGRPTSAAATAATPSVILAVPVAEAENAFRLAPQLATAVIEQLTAVGRSRRSIREVGEEPPPVATTAEPQAAPAVSVAVVVEEPASEAGPPRARGHIALPSSDFDETVFFKEDATCPICTVSFEHLRVRVGAVRPTGRDTDFRTKYRGTDPTFYSITVCPNCWYAAYAEEFNEVGAGEQAVLAEGYAQRHRPERANPCGVRSSDEAADSFQLALDCYEARSAGHRRRAGILHRRAWLERSRANETVEREYQQLAVDAYRSAYEADKSMTDASATRAAYLIGDLYLRLDALDEAGRWLEICLSGKHDAQSGILRMARERMYECRALMEERGAA